MENKKTLSNRLTTKYLLIVRNEENFAEKTTYTFTYAKIILSIVSIFLLLSVLSFYLTTTLLEEMFDPRFAQLTATRDVIRLTEKVDSLETEVIMKEQFIDNFKMIVSGEDDAFEKVEGTENIGSTEIKEIVQSEESINPIDSQFRKEFENRGVDLQSSESTLSQELQEFYLFKPVEGIVSDGFDPHRDHMGIDVVAKQDEPVKAVADGTVVFSSWTQDSGYVISIQHRGNLISMYKHNSELFKKVGNFVTAGEVISIIGNTGELTSGPHLHFELWYDGNPIDPEEFIRF
ncbi:MULTISPECIES: M23 family metallopeptidase [Reichenbachiella]|uniref:Peptidase family M23 n=1 Tax=Reichenbachiella agariperforans TaxID=156994 RepID=A0A1M6WQJ8_REIAG|nr:MULTISPECIES: M23 family metallopeptidase [Reichenbachiella]MBU2914779.1 M23 family metallopeptidase [Reichenbachiella agariperforans]RJE71193.1 peptidase M23 [Reichenbachiella sp. MSK19-1]SHK96040.1 Peptidase family M23 [Reichenbachiella agariperforans]